MQGKYARRSAGVPTECSSREESVATTVHISRQTLENLRDVALVREMADIAGAARGGRIQKRRRVHSVASVIEDPIELHRLDLEAEAELVLGGPRGTSASGRSRG